MVYSKSEEEFQQHADKFKVVACRDERNALWTYFETNWIACKEMWVALYRMDLPHFRNNTNNRLDNFLGKLKADLGSSMSMRLCLNAVIRYQRRREDEYVARVIMPGSKRNHRYNDDSNQLLGNDWLADIYSSEYKFAAAQGAMDSYVVEDEELFVTLRRDGRAHKVDKFNWLCSCEFSSTMQLPYRHSMMYRKNVCGLFMIPYASIPASVDAQFKDDGAAEIAEKVLSSWPCARLEGFDSDFTLKWAHVYCVRADCWFNDILVAAFAKVLANKYLNNTTIFLSELMTPAPNRGNRLPPPTLSQVAGATEAFVFMHLNINSSHWACIVLGTARRTIYCYDSMDKRAHHNLLEALAQELVKRSLPHAYQISSVHSPLQSDEYNCGLFVCLFFWRRLAKEVGSDYTERGLMRRRWDILRMVVQATMDKGSKEKSG
ncbi:hypothetical protein PC110_g2140 [Phytophthora cactorum]|uniref:Ubiquitin-like protease family profile domain-containing protein n=1 Tax=Phytophthora cactorum TaxID=29920 RepID=A0A329SX03_9STRA|nr:hypothetical protein PC110_g2140 [Phytophthora cactorum]